MKQFKRNVLAVGAFAVGAVCLLGGVAVLPVTASETATTEGYKAVFQDDFENGKLKEGWFDVSGNSVSDGTWNFGTKTSVVWGDGTNADSGKMLYDVGETVYMFSADVKFTDSESLNFSLPVIVTESGEGSAFTGVALNFQSNYAVLYDSNAEAALKRSDITTDDVKVLYAAIPGYVNGAAQTWSFAVEADTISVYVNGYLMVSAARPESSKSATVCGIGGNGVSAVEYDNFTVWTKGKIEQEAQALSDYDIGALFTKGDYVQLGTDYSSYITYDSTAKAATFEVGAEYETRLIAGLDVSDFTLTFKISALDSYEYLSASSGILFRASIDTANATVSGYYFTFNNRGGSSANIRKLTDVAYNKTGTALKFSDTSTVLTTFDVDKEITLSMIGNVITLTCDGETKTVTDDTYTSGSIGVKSRAKVNATGAYTLTFSECKTDAVESKYVAYDPDVLFDDNGIVSLYSKEDYKANMSYDASTNVLTVNDGMAWDNRLFANLDVADFKLDFKVSDMDTTKTASLHNMILFRTTYKESKYYGYGLLFYAKQGETVMTVNFYRIDGAAYNTAVDKLTQLGSTTVTLDSTLNLKVAGNDFVITAADGACLAVSDSTYASGSVGLRSRVSSTTTYKLTFNSFKIAKEALAAENASETLDTLKATNVLNTTKSYYYSVRKGETVNVSALADDVVGFVKDSKVYAETTERDVNVLIADYKIVGATIRLSDPSGLRFLTTLDENTYAKFEEYGLSGTYGTLLLPTEMLSDAALTLDTASALNITDEKLAPNAANTYSFRAAVTGIPSAQYGTAVTARSYITFTLADGSTRTVYSEALSRSVQEVAKKALKDEDVTYSDTQKQILEAFAGTTESEA